MDEETARRKAWIIYVWDYIRSVLTCPKKTQCEMKTAARLAHGYVSGVCSLSVTGVLSCYSRSLLRWFIVHYGIERVHVCQHGSESPTDFELVRQNRIFTVCVDCLFKFLRSPSRVVMVLENR